MTYLKEEEDMQRKPEEHASTCKPTDLAKRRVLEMSCILLKHAAVIENNRLQSALVAKEERKKDQG